MQENCLQYYVSLFLFTELKKSWKNPYLWFSDLIPVLNSCGGYLVCMCWCLLVAMCNILSLACAYLVVLKKTLFNAFILPPSLSICHGRNIFMWDLVFNGHFSNQVQLVIWKFLDLEVPSLCVWQFDYIRM